VKVKAFTLGRTSILTWATSLYQTYSVHWVKPPSEVGLRGVVRRAKVQKFLAAMPKCLETTNYDSVLEEMRSVAHKLAIDLQRNHKLELLECLACRTWRTLRARERLWTSTLDHHAGGQCHDRSDNRRCTDMCGAGCWRLRHRILALTELAWWMTGIRRCINDGNAELEQALLGMNPIGYRGNCHTWSLPLRD
jgi:hypothetical protein